MDIRERIRQLTAGKPYAFMLMQFDSGYRLFEMVQSVAAEFDLLCIRSDHLIAPGEHLLKDIHEAIAGAELVVAEVSKPNLNVFYELGYAMGLGKAVLPLVENRVTLPSDLRGMVYLPYAERDDRQAVEGLRQDLRGYFRQHTAFHSRSFLREMLVGKRALPIFVVAAPKSKNVGVHRPPEESGTFGDNIGIAGLFSAFGSLFWETTDIELVSGENCPDDLLERDANFFLIGAPRVNKLVRSLMERIPASASGKWEFNPPSGPIAPGSHPQALWKRSGDSLSELVAAMEPYQDGKRVTMDHGLIIRIPHPGGHEGRFVMILAGGHSLGTGAACLAATRASLIKKIIERPEIEMALRQGQGFWVLVRGAAGKDHLLSPEGVTIVDAEAIPQVAAARAS